MRNLSDSFNLDNLEDEIANIDDHQIEPVQENPTATVVKPSKRQTLIANTCLLVWAVVLAVIGMQAVSGNASTIILDFANRLVPDRRVRQSASPPPDPGLTNFSLGQSATNLSPDGTMLLDQYIQRHYASEDETEIPPIAIVLDRLQVSANWRDATAIDRLNGDNGPPSQSDYNNLFDIVAKRLEAIADFSPEPSVGNRLKLDNNILPAKFRATQFQEQAVDLPLEAEMWVKARQASITARKSQISFLDLFVLLIILGGFGSWIYLVRRHLNPDVDVDLQEYFYRPPLGMTLAIAVFIVNLTLHSFVSTSNINEVRRETLILLAFAAGLLSDRTYEFIENVTGEKLGHNTKKKIEDAEKPGS